MHVNGFKEKWIEVLPGQVSNWILRRKNSLNGFMDWMAS